MKISTQTEHFAKIFGEEKAIRKLAEVGYDSYDFSKINWEEVMTALKDIQYDGELTFEADNFLKPFPEELVVHASQLMLEVGRYLIDKYEL